MAALKLFQRMISTVKAKSFIAWVCTQQASQLQKPDAYTSSAVIRTCYSAAASSAAGLESIKYRTRVETVKGGWGLAKQHDMQQQPNQQQRQKADLAMKQKAPQRCSMAKDRRVGNTYYHEERRGGEGSIAEENHQCDSHGRSSSKQYFPHDDNDDDDDEERRREFIRAKAILTVQQSISMASAGTFRRILQRLHKAHYWDAALRMYASSKEINLKPEEMWGGMAVAHAVFKLLGHRIERMAQSDIKPDNKTFGPFIDGAEVFSDWRRMSKVLVHARKLGVSTTQRMYEIVIAACNRFGDYWLGSAEFLQMVEEGHWPSQPTLEAGLIAMCRAQQWRRALDVHRNWTQSGDDNESHSYKQHQQQKQQQQQQQQNVLPSHDPLANTMRQTKPSTQQIEGEGREGGRKRASVDVSEDIYGELIRYFDKCPFTRPAINLHRVLAKWPMFHRIGASCGMYAPVEKGTESLSKAAHVWVCARALLAAPIVVPILYSPFESLLEALINSGQYQRAVDFANELEAQPDKYYIGAKTRALIRRAERMAASQNDLRLMLTDEPEGVGRGGREGGGGPQERAFQRRHPPGHQQQGKTSSTEAANEANGRGPPRSTACGIDTEDREYSPFARVIWGAMEDELQSDEVKWEKFFNRFRSDGGRTNVGGGAAGAASLPAVEGAKGEGDGASVEAIPWPRSLVPSGSYHGHNKIDMRSRAYFEYLASRGYFGAKKKSNFIKWPGFWCRGAVNANAVAPMKYSIECVSYMWFLRLVRIEELDRKKISERRCPEEQQSFAWEHRCKPQETRLDVVTFDPVAASEIGLRWFLRPFHFEAGRSCFPTRTEELNVRKSRSEGGMIEVVALCLLALQASTSATTHHDNHRVPALERVFGSREEYWNGGFPSGWFGSNMLAKENSSQVAEIGKYKMANLGWQHEIWPSNFSHLAQTQISQLQAIKKAHPSLPLFLYLPAAFAPCIYSALDSIVKDPSVYEQSGGKYHNWFLQSTGQQERPSPGPLFTRGFCTDCLYYFVAHVTSLASPRYSPGAQHGDSWSLTGGLFHQVKANVSKQNCYAAYWNYANAEARQYILRELIEPLLLEQGFDGIFFDTVDYTLDQFPQFNITNIAGDPGQQCETFWSGMLEWQSELVKMLAAKGEGGRALLPMLSVVHDKVNFFEANEKAYLNERRMVDKMGTGGWVRYYEFVRGETAYQVLENMKVEAKMGIPVVMHVYMNSADEDLTTHIALFLIVRGDYFFFMASTGWFDDDWHW
eukprot:jgi/Bigna1/77339/fgenesh1_pg.47_\